MGKSRFGSPFGQTKEEVITIVSGPYVLMVKGSGAKKNKGQVVTYTEPATCPPSCALKGNGCYAENYPVSMHWNNIRDRGLNWDAFIDEMWTIPEGTFFRHNIAGDLPADAKNPSLISKQLVDLVEVCRQRLIRGATFSHYLPVYRQNRQLIEWSNKRPGLCINLSADSLGRADYYKLLDIAPVACILPASEERKQFRTKDGNKVAVCPASFKRDLNCIDCRLCWNRKREAIVGFPAHGSHWRKVENLHHLSP